MQYFLLTYFLAVSTLQLFDNAAADGDKGFLYCGVCRAMVKELRYDIRQVDPHKMVQIGSYRIDPDGSQRKRHEVPFARSSIHLHELVERVCDELPHYGLYTGPTVTAEEMQIVRGVNRQGKPLRKYHGNVASGENMGKRLKATCESILEDYEDDIVSLFNTSDEHKLCSEVVAECAQSSEVTSVDVPLAGAEEEEEEVVEEDANEEASEEDKEAKNNEEL